MSVPSINFLHLTVSEIEPGLTFSRRLPGIGENSTRQPLRLWGKNECIISTTIKLCMKAGWDTKLFQERS